MELITMHNGRQIIKIQEPKDHPNRKNIKIYDIKPMFKKEIEKREFPSNFIDFVLDAINNYEEDMIEKYKFYIKRIITSLLELKYHTPGQYIDPDILGTIVDSVNFLKCDFDYDSRLGVVDVEKLSREVYYDIVNNDPVYGLKLLDRKDEDWEMECILDIDGHFKNIKEWCKDNEELISIIDSDVWRIVRNGIY